MGVFFEDVLQTCESYTQINALYFQLIYEIAKEKGLWV